MINPKLILLLSVCFLIQACGAGSQEENNVAGNCEHIQASSIEITSVEEVGTGAQIQQIYLSNIMKNGLPIDLNQYSRTNTNVIIDVDGSAGYCTIPCAFLEGEGDVSFVVSVDGYHNITIEQTVEYSEFEGGCPSYSRDGEKITIQLIPVN